MMICAYLMQIDHFNASFSCLKRMITWQTWSLITQKYRWLPFCYNCCVSSMEMAQFWYFFPTELLRQIFLQSELMTASSYSTFLLQLSDRVNLVKYISIFKGFISFLLVLLASNLLSIVFFSSYMSNSSFFNFSFLVLRQSSTNWLAWTCSSDLFMDFLKRDTVADACAVSLRERESLREVMYCFMWVSLSNSSAFIGLLQ